MNNILIDLHIALKALDTAKRLPCRCDGLVKIHNELCTCSKAYAIQMAEIQVNTVRCKIRKMNLTIVQKGVQHE